MVGQALMDVIEAIHERRSIRSYALRPVKRDRALKGRNKSHGEATNASSVKFVQPCGIRLALRHTLEGDCAKHFRGERLLAGVLRWLRSRRPTEIAAGPVAIDAAGQRNASGDKHQCAREHCISPSVAAHSHLLNIAWDECGNTRTMCEQQNRQSCSERRPCSTGSSVGSGASQFISPPAPVPAQLGTVAGEVDAVAIDLALECADIGRLAALRTFSAPCLKEAAVTLRPVLSSLGCAQFAALVPQARVVR